MGGINNVANDQAHGSLLDCLSNSIPCTTDQATDLPAGGTPIGGTDGVLINQIFDASGALVYDASTPTSGLSAQGIACTTFVNPTIGPGDDSCPLRFEVRWWAKCKCANANCSPVAAGDTCVKPQVQLQVKAIYNPSGKGDRFSFNPSNYGTPPFLQGQDPGGVCWQLSGTNLYETCAANVGIGTNTPGTALDINGMTTFRQSYFETSSTLSSGAQTISGLELLYSANISLLVPTYLGRQSVVRYRE